MTTKTTKIWLVCSFDPETKQSSADLAYFSKDKAESGARTMLGYGKYISLKSLEIRDAE